MGLTWALSKR
uniref:Uncharacterized protein n=1 Tax=Arundo donax TaxID=35708 RepID=A0A0A9EQ60_ARUDO